uniref:Uncharacterized protein n=1 Tax=Arundo donax TaxID=35708 RepID=A0A0A9DUX8_ARUDO
MGTTAPEWFTRPASLAVCSRFISTSAATTRVTRDRAIPVPIRCSMVMPEAMPVTLRATGTRTRSYSNTQVTMLTPRKHCSAAGGTWNDEPTLRSSVAACFVNSVGGCANTTP